MAGAHTIIYSYMNWGWKYYFSYLLTSYFCRSPEKRITSCENVPYRLILAVFFPINWTYACGLYGIINKSNQRHRSSDFKACLHFESRIKNLGPHMIDLLGKREQARGAKTNLKISLFPEQTEPVQCEHDDHGCLDLSNSSCKHPCQNFSWQWLRLTLKLRRAERS